MTGGQQAAHETSTSKLNERASFEMMRPDAAVGSRFIYFSVKDDFPLKMDRSCLMPLVANRNLFRAQRSGLSPIKSLHFLKKLINVIGIFRQELHKSDENSMWIVCISAMYLTYDVVANYKQIAVFKTSEHTCD